MLRLRLQLVSAFNLLATLAGRLLAPAELLAPATPIVARAIEQNFDEEGRPVRWPPLAPATLRRKPPGLRILELTGRLRRSIRTRVEGDTIVASTDVPYAAAHQFGFAERRLPARPFLVLTQDDLAAVAESIANSLEATGRRAPNTKHLQ